MSCLYACPRSSDHGTDGFSTYYRGFSTEMTLNPAAEIVAQCVCRCFAELNLCTHYSALRTQKFNRSLVLIVQSIANFLGSYPFKV